MRRINLMDGKYTIVYDRDTGTIKEVLRYGEPWRDVTGDNLIHALVNLIDNCEMDRLGCRAKCNPSDTAPS
jgi:hypothetical protein